MSYSLKTLQLKTEESIEKARNIMVEFPEAINWADLHCHSAEYAIDQDCNGHYRVYIEEASPTCPKFQSYIADRLEEEGFENIEVITEW